MTSPEVHEERARIEAEAKKEEDAVQSRRMEHCRGILEKKLADVPEEMREAAREAVLADPAARTAEQKELLEIYPMVKPPQFISGLLVEYDGAAHAQPQERVRGHRREAQRPGAPRPREVPRAKKGGGQVRGLWADVSPLLSPLFRRSPLFKVGPRRHVFTLPGVSTGYFAFN